MFLLCVMIWTLHFMQTVTPLHAGEYLTFFIVNIVFFAIKIQRHIFGTLSEWQEVWIQIRLAWFEAKLFA